MAKTRHRDPAGQVSQEMEDVEVIEVSDTTAGASTSPEDNPLGSSFRAVGYAKSVVLR